MPGGKVVRTGQAGAVTLSRVTYQTSAPTWRLTPLSEKRRRGHKKGVLKPLPTLAAAGRNLRNVKVQTWLLPAGPAPAQSAYLNWPNSTSLLQRLRSPQPSQPCPSSCGPALASPPPFGDSK